jgi:hypothetical protein
MREALGAPMAAKLPQPAAPAKRGRTNGVGQRGTKRRARS